jgi:hypothetical protein
MYLSLFLTPYMFRAHRAHHQERQIVSIQPLFISFYKINPIELYHIKTDICVAVNYNKFCMSFQ